MSVPVWSDSHRMSQPWPHLGINWHTQGGCWFSRPKCGLLLPLHSRAGESPCPSHGSPFDLPQSAPCPSRGLPAASPLRHSSGFCEHRQVGLARRLCRAHSEQGPWPAAEWRGPGLARSWMLATQPQLSPGSLLPVGLLLVFGTKLSSSSSLL